MYKLIRSYFLLSFRNNRFINTDHMIRKYKAFILRRIHISKPEIKHTNTKAKITLFSFNLEKNYFFYKKFLLLNEYTNKKILKISNNFLKKKIEKIKSNYLLLKESEFNVNPLGLSYKSRLQGNFSRKELILFKYKLLNQMVKNFNFYLKIYFYLIKMKKYRKIKRLYYNKLTLKYRKCQYKYYICKYKFEKTKFLPILTKLLNKYINKKIEYNIINLKSIVYSPDIFTKALSLKLRKRRIYLYSYINNVLGQVNIFSDNNVILLNYLLNPEKDSFINKYKNLCLIDALKEGKGFLKNINKVNYNDTYQKIFKKIKYKKIGGILIKVNGRLSRRYRADRSVHRTELRGGLKDFQSSFQGQSGSLYRNTIRSNVIYSFSSGTRRIGQYGIHG